MKYSVKKKCHSRLINSLLLATGVLTAQSAMSQVVSSIHPIGFITQAITEGVVEHQVMAPSSISPHDYAMRPSDVKLINDSELFIWIGDDLEAFLAKPMANKSHDTQIKLSDIKAISALMTTDEEGNEHAEGHEHEKNDVHEHEQHDAHGHDHSTDWHIWMSPQIAELTAEQIAEKLLVLHPEHKQRINANLAEFKESLQNTRAQISEKLKEVQTAPYYVFHDAYGYFENEFELNRAGAFTVNPTIMPGAQQLADIKKILKQDNVACVFKEPQFTPNVINAVIQGTEVRVGELDPVGRDIKLSKSAYFEFLNSLADSYITCLK